MMRKMSSGFKATASEEHSNAANIAPPNCCFDFVISYWTYGNAAVALVSRTPFGSTQNDHSRL